MAIQPTSNLHLESIVKRICLVEGEYACEILDPKIEEAERELDEAVMSQSSALGHSASMDVEAAQAKLNRYLEAQALCELKKAAKAEGADAAALAATQAQRDPYSHAVDFSRRRIE